MHSDRRFAAGRFCILSLLQKHDGDRVQELGGEGIEPPTNTV
jgi:hypothetical protein